MKNIFKKNNYYIDQILICTKDLYFSNELNPCFIKNNKYKIIDLYEINDPVFINEHNERHSLGDWNKWFIGKEEYRCKKFEKILR